MKAERINQDQVRFTIDANDLISRNLRVSELAYGSQKTQALFDEMMKQAMEMFGMDFSEKPLMIEAIPLSDDKLSVTVTRVEGMAEIGSMIGANLPGVNAMNSDPFQGATNPLKGGKMPDGKPAESGPSFNLFGADAAAPQGDNGALSISMQIGNMAATEPVVYFFKELETLLQVAADVPEKFPLKNRLFRDTGNGYYYLICEFRNVGPKTRHLIAMLSQYAIEWYAGHHVALMAEEHSTKVFGSNALQKLGTIQRT